MVSADGEAANVLVIAEMSDGCFLGGGKRLTIRYRQYQ
jgi:hypothetical protein